MEEGSYQAIKESFEPRIALREIFAIPFNHWKKDREWMVLVIIDGESIIQWVDANTPEEAAQLALEQSLRLLF